MKKATLFAAINVMLTLVFLVSVSAQNEPPKNLTKDERATAKAQRKQNDKDLNKGLDDGTTCFDYQLDVVSLIDNDHRMYWRDKDCIRVHVTNNPFLFKYDLTFDENLIKEDDPLASFGKNLGVNVTSTTNAGGNTDNNKTDQSKAQTASPQASTEPAAKNLNTYTNTFFFSPEVRNFDADPDVQTIKREAPSIQKFSGGYDIRALDQTVNAANRFVAKMNQQKKQTSAMQRATEQARGIAASGTELQAQIKVGPPTSAQMENWKTAVASLHNQACDIETIVKQMQDEYLNFSSDVQHTLRLLIDPQMPAKTVYSTASDLRDRASKELTGILMLGAQKALGTKTGTTLELPAPPDPCGDGCPNSTVTLEKMMLQFARLAAPLHSEISKRATGNNADIDKLLQQLHDDGETVAYHACAYKTLRDTDLVSVRTHLIAPLDAVLTDGFAFGYKFPDASYKREGPFGDPMAVTMTLKRQRVYPFTTSDGSSAPTNTTSKAECSSDTSDMLANGAKYATFNDFFTDKPVEGTPNTYTRNLNKPTPTSKSVDPPTDNGDGNAGGNTNASNTDNASDNKDTVLVQPWLFGRARLVVSGGLTFAFLAQKDYQRSTSVSGANIVGVKTDSKYRLSPMLYGHVLLPWYGRHQSDAWYGAFGVTAKSDSKGTDPEFLLGLSRSFAQQRFFLTTGAYIGEKQTLDGGLQVGSTIPSSLTGELPVTKGYHVGWGFGISYRFTSTKDPQKDTSTQNTSSQKKTSK